MGSPLKNPPVYLTLAQVRFNPILKLADYLPSIQENFRHDGYPDFEHQQLISIQITTQDGQPVPKPVPLDRYQFGNAAKTHVFILDGQSLTLQSTNYGQFEIFSACFQKGLEIINHEVNLAFTERIGLRYLDRVMPQEGEKIEQYLAGQVHGMTSHLGGRPIYSFTEALNEIGNMKLMSRVTIQEGPLTFPPDLQPGNMVVAEKFMSYNGKGAILDNDGFIEGREAFSSKVVADHLDALHKVIGTAFRATATTHAFTSWDK